MILAVVLSFFLLIYLYSCVQEILLYKTTKTTNLSKQLYVSFWSTNQST